MLVLLLTAFLAIILEIDEDELTEEETGGKMIHGDVFRCPPYANLFSALMGAGAQIFFTILLLLTSR